ncbi:thiol-disulfide oxidoreductase DCC family protein [Lysinibacillus sp. 54212]|uniref:thiol-disulfide oxidoreductase DCC family protein n=1 Tax=Lysinibacillus sp. 54212 TaxID=3119829 RepID=UPI002FC76858
MIILGIVLFDGLCHFCDASVQFILKRDKQARINFAALQSNKGAQLKEQYRIEESIDSLVFIDEERAYVKSDAALKIAKKLNGLWKLAYLAVLIPRPIRDYFYDIVAKNRYKWFGQRQSCMLPTKEQRNRFID